VKSINLKVVGSVVAVTLVAIATAAFLIVQPGAAAATPASTVGQASTIAQVSASPTASSGSSQATPAAKPQGGFQQYADLYQQKLADGLGVSKDKLATAQKDASKAVVAQMVKDGKLTQAQADALNTRIDAGMGEGFPFGGHEMGRGMDGPGMMGRGGMMGDMGKVVAAVAAKLGLTSEQLISEIRGGKSLLDIAKEKNVSEADLKATIVATLKPILDKAVKDGKLTQAQEDATLKQVQDADLSKGFGFGQRGMGGPGMGNHQRGMGGMGGWGDPAQNQNTQNQDDSSTQNG